MNTIVFRHCFGRVLRSMGICYDTVSGRKELKYLSITDHHRRNNCLSVNQKMINETLAARTSSCTVVLARGHRRIVYVAQYTFNRTQVYY